MTTTSTDGGPIAGLAALLADRTRASFCLALLDGRAWTAGELARTAGVAASTASDHLTRLVRGGLLVEERQGRHRYVRLAGPSVAQLIEDLAGHAPAPTAPPRTLRAASAGAALAYARTCYDHLAGRLGVRLYDALLARNVLDRSGGLALTPAGLDWLAELGVPVEPLRAARRPLVRDCLDWTERRPHLAGGARGGALPPLPRPRLDGTRHRPRDPPHPDRRARPRRRPPPRPRRPGSRPAPRHRRRPRLTAPPSALPSHPDRRRRKRRFGGGRRVPGLAFRS